MHWDQGEAMEVDDGQAAARVSKDLWPEQLKDRQVHQILARIPLRPLQPNEKTNGQMKAAAYHYCVQFQDRIEADECKWWVYEHIKNCPN